MPNYLRWLHESVLIFKIFRITSAKKAIRTPSSDFLEDSFAQLLTSDSASIFSMMKR